MLSDKTVEEILNVSSTILLRWLSNPEITDEKKIPVISQFVSKRIPVTNIVEGNITITEMKDISIGNRIQEFIVGDHSS